MGISKPIAIPATTGAKTAINATLLINSVIKIIKVMSNTAVAKTLILLVEIAVETTSTIPLTDMPFANANPPPKRINIPQASFSVSFHLII